MNLELIQDTLTVMATVFGISFIISLILLLGAWLYETFWIK